MMKASHVLISLALVATSLYLVSITIINSPSPSASSVQFMQRPATLFTSRKLVNLHQDRKKAVLMQKETFLSKEQESKHSEDILEGEEAIYHTDYHGVTTHPAPTPIKHLKP
ncbi:unnamed protein product [Rhodiola kirilowii]